MGNPGNSIVCLPTGSGKSLVIANFAHKLQRPVLILQPSKELLEQNIGKLRAVDPTINIGVFSASMNEKTVDDITFGTIQSVYKHPELFRQFGVAIVDEGDLVPLKKLSGMYRKFFRQAGIHKVFGMTATPFRQDTFYKEPPEGWNAWKQRRWRDYATLEVVTTTKMLTRYKEKFWERMLVVVNTQELMDEGYLSPLLYAHRTVIEHEDIPLNGSRSDFDWEGFDEVAKKKMTEVIRVIDFAIKNHKSVIVFCATITQAEDLALSFPESKVVTSKTSKKARNQIVEDLRSGTLKCVFNVSVLTVGFDHPSLDCIVLARPTRSLRLHCQILGRGTRNADGKTHCQVYDLVGNVKNLGKLEEIKVERVDGAWNVTSDAHPKGMHMKEMFSFTVNLGNTASL